MSPEYLAMNPGIAVAMCTFNGGPFLRDQIDSILGQSVQVQQIVIADDGSVDSTLEVLHQLSVELRQRHASPVLKILEGAQTPLGPTRNFERAIAACDHEFIALCDQDDVWEVNRVEAGMHHMLTSPTMELVVSDASLVDVNGRLLGRTVWHATGVRGPQARRSLTVAPLPFLLRENRFPGMTFLLRRSLVDRALPAPDHWMHDHWLSLNAAASGTLKVHDGSLVHYRQHDQNTIGAAERAWPTPRQIIRVFNRRLQDDIDIARWLAAEDRVRQLKFRGDAERTAVKAKLGLEMARSTLPEKRLGRPPAIMRLLITGAYSKYARHAWRRALQDLLASGNRRPVPRRSSGQQL